MIFDEEIIELMDKGLTWNQVTKELNISYGTLSTHMKRIHKNGYPYRKKTKKTNQELKEIKRKQICWK